MDKVDATMAAIQEQTSLATEISDAISNPMNAGVDLDEVCPPRRATHYAAHGRRVMRTGRAEGGACGFGAGRAEREVDERRPRPRAYAGRREPRAWYVSRPFRSHVSLT